MELRLAVISVLVATSLSGPVKNLNSNSKCATQCTSKDKFGYRVGTVYEYSYEAETKTGISGATEEQGGLKVTATAEIEVLTKCEFLLTVKNSDIYGSDPDYPRQFKVHPQRGEFQKQFEQHPLRFSFQDGVVEELCPDSDESDWTLNFKRGILSSFQNSMEALDRDTEVLETDVTGKCPTVYKIKQEGWQSVKIRKTKDLSKCVNRHGFQTSAQSTIYSVPSSVQSLPLLDTSHECNLEISTQGRVEKSVCHEIHLFKPFSKGGNGAITEVTQKLTFVTDKVGGQIVREPVTIRSSLLYHHHDPETITTNKKSVAINKLSEICTTTKDGITAETPRLFSELVHALKELSASDLSDVYQQSQMDSFCIDNSERVKKFYTDAVPMIGTTAAVEQIAQLILNNEITGRMAEIWLSSLSLIQNPSTEMLEQIAKLIDLPEGIKVYLPASVMVNTFCKNTQSCESVSEIQTILNKLKRAVGSGCIVTDTNYLEVLTALRAIGNIEQSSKVVPVVSDCIRKKENEDEIRIAAIEAYRRMSCSVDRNNLLELFKDTKEDSELRIVAYIQIMKCPSESIIPQIKEALGKEEVNQVGSFVWTHLTNLMETSMVNKQSIQEILEDETLKKEFDLDKRKFSRNYEWSYFSETMNAGAGLESNIIFSQQSFVPRSAMVNLTIDLFGHSVNLFEIGGRVEGLEKILMENFAKNQFGAKQDMTPEQKQSRDVDFNKVERLSEKLGKTEQEMKGAVFVRMFGNEITYYNTKQSSGNSVNQKKFNFLEMFMNLANNHQFSQKMSKVLLDSSIITPTVTGLPLNLKVTATSTVDMNASGKMDLRSPSRKVVMEGSISPSGAVDVSSVMSVDAFVTKSGLRMVSNFHSSTSVSAKFELDKKQELTMEFSIPKERSEIVNAKSQFFIVHGGEEHEQRMITKNRTTRRSCSGATIARVTGVEFCLDMSLPGDVKDADAPHFPLTGPAKFALEVLKRDTHTSYKYEFKIINDKKKTHIMMMYDTPGSKIQRRTGFGLEVNHHSKTMEMSLTSPWKTAKVEGNLKTTKRKKTATGVVTVDSKKLYQAEGSVQISESKSQKTYKPKIEIIRPEADPIVFGGDVIYRPGKVMTSKLVLTGALEKPASLDLNVRFTRGQYGFTGSLLFNKDQKYRADMDFEMSGKGKRTVYTPRIILSSPDKEYINFFGKVTYLTNKGKVLRYDLKLDKVFSKAMKLKGESVLLAKGKRMIYKGKVYLNGPQKISTTIRYLFDKKLRSISTSVKLDYNFQKFVKSLKDSIQYSSKLQKKSVKRMQLVTFKSNLKSARFSEYNNKIALKVDHRPNSKVDADLTVDYGRTFMSEVNKQRMSILSSTKYNINEKRGSGVVNYNVTFRLPAEKLDSYFSGTHKYSNTEMNSNLHIRYDNKKSADVIVNFNDQSKKYFKYSGEFALKYTGRHIQVSGIAVEKDKEYTTRWSFQPQEQMSSSLTASYGWPKDKKREFDSSVKIYQQKPIDISSSVMMDDRRPEVNAKIKIGKDFYVISGMGQYDGKMYIQGQGKLAYPARQITIETEGGYKNELYSGKLDVNLDAKDKASRSRVYVEGSMRNNTIEDFDVSTKLEYPGRELSATIAHFSKNKIDTTVSFGWQKNKAVGVTVKFDKDFKKFRHRIEGSVALTTPWKELLEFEIGGNHAFSKKRIDLGATFTWNKGKTVAFQYESKLPMNPKDIDMILSLRTPVPQVGNPSISLQSTISNDLIDQRGIMRVTWGKNQFLEIETNGKSLSRDTRRNLHRNIGVMTSFEGYRQITLNWTHEDDMQKFLSKATYIKDGIKYLYILDMDHFLDGWSMQNNGKFDIKSPHDSLAVTWSHRNVEKEFVSTFNTLWGKSGHRFFAKAMGRIEDLPHRKYSANLEVKIPMSDITSLNLDFEHEDKAGFVKSMGRFVLNRENFGTVKLDYTRQLGSTDFEMRISGKFMEDFVIEGKTRHAHLPMTGSLKIEWKPMQNILLDGSVHYNKLGNLDSKLTLKTPFQRARRIVLVATHLMDHLDWVAMTELEFAPMQKIKAELRYNTGVEKLARLQITTPFPQFKKLSTGAYFKFIVSPTQWENNVDFEIVPLVRKITAVTRWRHDTETKASFRIDTPFQKIPYMTTEFESKKAVNGKRESRMMLEYLPTQKIELSSSYVLRIDGGFEGSVSIKTPYNDEVFANYLQGGYSKNQLRGFQRRVQLKYSRTQNIVIDTTFGTKPKIFGIMKIEMPIRGYETVKLAFEHKGTTWKNFQTNLEYDTNGKKIELQTLFDITDDIKGKVKVTSPFQALKIAQVAYSHEGILSNFKTHASAIFNDFQADANAVFTHNDLQTAGSFSFKSPIDGAKDLMLSFNKDGTLNNLSFNGEAGYETGSKYVVAVKHNLGENDIATDIVIQSPLTEDIILKIIHDNRRKGFTTIIEGAVGTDNSVKFETSYRLRNFDLDLEFDITSVISGERNNVIVVFDHKGKWSDFTSLAKVKTSFANIDDQFKVSFKSLNEFDNFDAKVEIKDTWKQISVNAGLKSDRKGNVIVSEAMYNSNIFKSEISITDRIKHAKLTAQTEIEGYENFEAEIIEDVHRRNQATYTITVKGPFKKPIVIVSNIKLKGNTEFSGDFKVTTGFEGFEDMEGKLEHNGDFNNFVSSVEIKKSGMKQIKAEARLNAVVKTSIDGTISFTSGIDGAENVVATFKHKGDQDDFNCDVSLSLPERLPAKLNIEFTNSYPQTVKGKVMFTSDLKGAENVIASFKHSGDFIIYSSEATVTIPKRKPFELVLESSQGANSYMQKIAFTSDIKGAEQIGYSIDQVTKANTFTQKVIVNPFNSKNAITQEIKYKARPTRNSYEVMYSLTGMKGMKDINVGLVHKGDISDFENTVAVAVPGVPLIKTIAKFNVNNKDYYYSDINGEARFESEIEGAERLYLTVEHSTPPGAPFEWKNRATMKLPLMQEITIATTLNLQPNKIMEATVDFNSKIPGLENIGFSTVNKVVDEEKKHLESQTEVKLDSLRKVNFDAEGKVNYLDPYNSEILLKFDIITPFDELRTFNAEYSVTSNQRTNLGAEELEQKNALLISLNGKKYWDTQGTYEMTDQSRFRYDFLMVEPKQMEYGYIIHTGNPYILDFSINWDKNEPNSNFRLESKFQDLNDLKIRAIYPTRTASIEAAFKGELERSAKLVLTWDEAKSQAVGIETKWQDQRPDLDVTQGSVKIVTPWKAVETSGSINKALTRKTMEGTVFWDAEVDRSKSVTVMSEVTPDKNGYSGKVQLSLPVIGKELTFSRQMTENEGAVLYECRNEFSYSTDPTKTIVVTTKLEDVSEFGSSNHTYTVGISQEATKVDISVMTHLGTSEKKDSTGMLVTYKTSHFQKKNLLLLAEIDKLHKKLILMTVGPRKAAGVVGQVQGDIPKIVTINGLFSLENIVDTNVIIDSKKKAMEIQMKYDKDHPNKVLHIAAKYPSRTNFETQIYRTGDKPQITDSVIKVNLRTSRILHSKVNWRPEAVKELMTFGVDGFEHYGKAFNTEFIATANEMEAELTAKYTAISTELQTELKPYIDSLSKSLRTVQHHLNKVKEQLDRMHKNNDMYVRDVVDNMKEKSAKMMTVYRKAIVQMKDIVSDMRKQIDKLKDLKDYPFEQKYRKFVNDAASKIQTFKQEMVDTIKEEMDTITKKIKASVEELRNDLQKISDRMTEKLSALLDNVLEKAEVKELMSYIDDILKNLPDSTNIPDIDWKHYMTKINKAIKYKLSQLDLAKTYNDVLESTKSAVINQLEPVLQDSKVKELRDMADQLQKKITQAYKRWNIEKTIKSYLIALYNDFGTYIKEDIAKLKFLHWDKNRIIAFDPENGNIEFELYLPTPADTLDSLPKSFNLRLIKSIDKFVRKIDSLELPKVFDFSIWDLYYKYKPSMNPADWVPPFDAYALVAGDQHFITFDKKQIDFGGRCSYVLVKDMVNNQFTVIMNYNGKRRPSMQSLLVLAEGKSVEIRPDFSVKLDNKPTELPIKYQKLSIIRDGNLVQIDTGKGLVISGNLANQHIAFVLSGWYFGNVGGLLGSYDNEQYDDMIDSDGQVTSDINTMVRTWEVASRCRNPSNILSEVIVKEGKKGFKKCSNLFMDSDSSLRPCFRVVDPDYFMKVCMSEMQTSKGDGCNAVSAYVKQCRQEGVMLWEPKACLTCSAPNKEKYEGGEFIKLSTSKDDFQVPESADVVFVVEQTDCNSKPASHLGDLVDKVEQALTKKGIKDNRYGLIGFGGTPRSSFGRKSASSTHTFEGSIFSESNNFAKGKETLSFKYHFTDPLEAILTAADMPFRAGVSKTVVLLHCGQCDSSKNVNYNHVKHVLLTRGITLHIIRDQDIRLSGNSSPKNTIYGFDNNNKYMIKPMKDISSKDISIPEDSCVSLTLKTDGSMFHASGLTDSKIRSRKWFMNTVSKRISESAKPDECQVCQCVADHTGMAKSVCRTCYTKVSDYLPNWWSMLKQPSKIKNQFEKQFKDYFGDDTWEVLNKP